MSNRPSPAQLETLVEFLEANVPLARGYLRTLHGKNEAKRKWAELATQLNALGGVCKDGPGWAKYWAERKCSLKKLCAQHAASVRQTGGGSGQSFGMAELDLRLVTVMGGTSFASGDSSLGVNPFPETQSSESSQVINIGDIYIPPPSPPPPAITIEVDTPPPLPHSSAPVTQTSATNPVRRQRRILQRSVDAEMDRMAAIEERRVEAERLSAEALADASRRLGNLTEAVEHVAQAISEVASALRIIANK